MTRNQRHYAPRGKNPMATLNSMKIQLMGSAYKPNPDPPNVVLRPWFPVVITGTSAGSGDTVTSTDLVAAIRAQLGLPSTTELQFKLVRIAVWGSASGDPVRLTALEPDVGNTSNSQVRFTSQDTGTTSRRASVGYIYPSRDSQNILLANAFDLFRVAGSALVWHAQLLWQVRQTIDP
jgi:hypothetical protein